MAWLDDNYKARKAFSIVTTASASTVDVTWTVPTGWDAFWTAIDANGYGVRFTAPDGVTEIDHHRATWDYANRSAVFNLDDMDLPGATDRCVLIWVYFGAITPTDVSASFTPGTTATATMELGQPEAASAIPLAPQIPGEAAPADRIAKGTGEVRDVFFDVTEAMQPAGSRYNGRRAWEEPGVAAVDVLNDAGASQAAMNEATAMRWVSVESGNGAQRLYLRARVKAGTDNSRYTLSVTVQTATPLSSPTYRTLPARLGVQVKDQLET